MIIPPRLLAINITSITLYSNWGISDTSDPWVNNGYQWTLVLSVTPQAHSYPLSQTPYYYNGLDIQVGDWISDLATGKAVIIKSISSQTASAATVIVEDLDRYNTFTDSSGNGIGIGNTGSAYLFELGDDGLPILTPMSTLSTTLSQNLAWQLDQISRFRYRNLIQSYFRVDQPGNTFNLGDIISLSSSGSYNVVSAASSSILNAIGVVTSVGTPSSSYFTYRPFGKITTSSVTLPGNPGDFVYVAAGSYTNTAPTVWAKPVFIKITNTQGSMINGLLDFSNGKGYVAQSSVVSSPANLPSNANPGDSAFVENSGFAEWSHNVYQNGTWTVVGTQDSSHVDAESYQVSLSGSLSSSQLLLGNISATRVILSITVQVTAAFDSQANCSVYINSNSVSTTLFDNSVLDLTTVGTYTTRPNYLVPFTYSQAYVSFTAGSTTSGSALVTISYV